MLFLLLLWPHICEYSIVISWEKSFLVLVAAVVFTANFIDVLFLFLLLYLLEQDIGVHSVNISLSSSRCCVDFYYQCLFNLFPQYVFYAKRHGYIIFYIVYTSEVPSSSSKSLTVFKFQNSFVAFWMSKLENYHSCWQTISKSSARK